MMPRSAAWSSRWIAVGCLLGTVGLSSARAQMADPTLARAQQEAAASGRLVLLHFGATWCGPCMRLEREVFHDANIQRQIDQQYVMVKIDADQSGHLVQQFGVRSFPTDIVLDAQGRVVYQQVSPQGAGYLVRMQEVAAAHPVQRPAAPALAAQQPPRAGAPGVPPSQPMAPAQAAAAPSVNPPVGLDGFCPVSLTDARAWKAGDPRYGAIHRGRLYLFSGADQQQRFLANPDRYSPVASGVDPVMSAELGRQVAGNRQFGAFYGDRVYLFATKESLEKFMQQPTRFAQVTAPVRR